MAAIYCPPTVSSRGKGETPIARGQSQAADTNLTKTNQLGEEALSGFNARAGQLTPAYTNLMDTGYLSPQEEEATTNTVMGTATAPFKSAEFEAKNRAAATRNPADLTAQQDQLALEEGTTAGAAADTLEQQKLQNQEAGMYGLNQLGNEQLGFAQSMYGLGPSTLQARAAGQNVDAALAESAMSGAGAGFAHT